MVNYPCGWFDPEQLPKKMMKHKQILKLVVYTDKDIMSENFDEQLIQLSKRP